MLTETIDKFSRSRKTMDWSIVVFINFLWATQVPMIRLIGERLGAITVAYLSHDRPAHSSLFPSYGWRIENASV